MSAIKDGRYPVNLNGKDYHLLFSLNALDAIQDKFGGYDKLDVVFDSSSPTMIKDLKWLLTMLINEGLDEGEAELTEQQVGRMVHTGNMNEIQRAIFAAFAVGANGGEEREETEEDNEEDTDKEGNAGGAQES
jgi:hypothetical protein